MVFLTNEFTKKAEIAILSARESTRPGLQTGALWVERKAYIMRSVARESSRPLNQPCSELVNFFILVFFRYFVFTALSTVLPL